MSDTDDSSLAQRLKQGTSLLHRQAERSGLMASLVQGRIDAAGYRRLLVNLLAIYRALEAALEQHRADPLAGFTASMGLQRAQRLAGDLAHLFPGVDASSDVLVPATTAYVERVQALAASAPLRLVAHAYVRYLGDLHGGQMLGRIVRQRFDLAGEDGTRFYDFGDDTQVRAQRAAFRQALDALPASATQRDAIVAEAVEAFARHVQLFEELATRPAAGAAVSR